MKTQKELKELYKKELAKAWEDEKMQDFCLKNAAYIIEYDNGLFEIDKPRIQKDFCFAYGMYAQATAEEINEAEAMSEHARTSEQYFIDENLKGINDWIKQLKTIAEEMRLNWAEGSRPHYMVATNAHYYGQTEDCKLKSFSIVNTFDMVSIGTLCEDIEFVEMLIDGYEKVKEDFTKRLKAYLKKYGTSKVNSWTYLVD